MKKNLQEPGKQLGSTRLVRLNKLISNAGICARRAADKLIQTGQITVNDKPVTILGYKVSPQDVVKYRGQTLPDSQRVYILLNKPKDYITTSQDPQGRKTVLQLVESACSERIYPVGRLDRNTTGLLLLTNDGALAEKLSHPASNVKKLYYVVLDKPLSEADYKQIEAGVLLEDGLATIDKLAIAEQDRKSIGLEIHIGRNRIVRRIFEQLGYKVIKLDRVMYGHLTKKGLQRGKWRFLTQREVGLFNYLRSVPG